MSDAPTAARNPRKIQQGVVASAKMHKTITVKVERRIPHPRYGKIVRRYSTFKAHDEDDTAREGDIVEIMETRPLSKTKRWRLLKIVTRYEGAGREESNDAPVTDVPVADAPEVATS